MVRTDGAHRADGGTPGRDEHGENRLVAPRRCEEECNGHRHEREQPFKAPGAQDATFLDAILDCKCCQADTERGRDSRKRASGETGKRLTVFLCFCQSILLVSNDEFSSQSITVGYTELTSGTVSLLTSMAATLTDALSGTVDDTPKTTLAPTIAVKCCTAWYPSPPSPPTPKQHQKQARK